MIPGPLGHPGAIDLQAGYVIDQKYEVVRLVGRGGMGSVYEGRHRRIHRRVAIKVLHSIIASNHAVVQRFEREAQAAGRIGSEHIVEVLDIGELPSGERYMVMEFLDGMSLGARLALEGQLLPEHAFPIVAELLEGLSAAHDAGIVHRDLKPDNIWLARSASGRGEFVKILDFGVSKFRTGERDVDVTQTGVVVGTPNYMAPEQARADRDIDARADIYAVGIILYRCLAGRLPFEGATYNELMFKVVLEDPPPLEIAVPGLDPEAVGIVHRALERDRDRRYPTATAFKSALVAYLQGNGFPVSLAVADLLQSGDRVGAGLLQSGDGSIAPASSRAGDEAPEEAWFAGDATKRHAPASPPTFDGDRTTRQTPLAKRDPILDEESTELLEPEALMTMNASERDDAITPRKSEAPSDDDATIQRAVPPLPFHGGIEMPTHMTASLSGPTPAMPARAAGATLAVAVAASVVLLALLVGIGMAAAGDAEPPRAAPHLGLDLQRIAAAAARAASDAEVDARHTAVEVAEEERTEARRLAELAATVEGDGGEGGERAEGEAREESISTPAPAARRKPPPKADEPPPPPGKNGKDGRVIRREL